MLLEKLQAHVETNAPLSKTQVAAALGLLQYQLPKLSATDITSKGEALTVERVMFKPSNGK